MYNTVTMPKVAIVTDSTACIPERLLHSLNIKWVPYFIHRGKETLRDLKTIQSDTFYQWLPNAKELPTTACPGPGDYLQVYERLVNEQDVAGIASIHMTSKASGAYHAAKVAQSMILEKFPNLHIEVIDTLNVSMCHGWMVVEAARAALDGKSLTDVVKVVQNLIPLTQMLQTADTLRYLYLGGRIGKAKHLVGSLLNIKPIISMQDGVIVPLGQARSRKKVYRLMVNKVESAVGYMGKIKVAYVHAAAHDEAEKIKNLLEARLDPVESLITELSPALGVHTGPGTAGLCYYPLAAD
jgi:DegV family protein with EDD domain